MKEYDIAFSLGFSCGTSQALRAAGLQFASYPLDWTGTQDIVTSMRQVLDDFFGWFEAEDFVLVDVRHGSGFCTRCYRNSKTNLGFSHEFSDFVPFDVSFPTVRGTYSRRVERFIECTRASRRILAVYMEFSSKPRAADEYIVSARQALAKKLPHAEVDLLYVYVDPKSRKPVLKEMSKGVYVAGFDYRVYDEGKLSHYIDWAPLVPFLRENFRVVDSRSEDEKKSFVKFEKTSNDMRWGPDKSRFRRWLNKHAYKTYRSLERILGNRGLVHKEGPLWFWDE
jgi:hypothetical protein